MEKILLTSAEDFEFQKKSLHQSYKCTFWYGDDAPESYPCVMVTTVRDVSSGWDVTVNFVYPSDMEQFWFNGGWRNIKMWYLHWTMNDLPPIAHFFVRSDLAVIGRNPEMADMDNPDGNIFGFGAYVVMESGDGRRFAHVTTFTDDDEKTATDHATRLMGRIEAKARYLAYSTSHPLNPNFWTEIEPRYGSTASEAFIQEAAEEAERAAGWDSCPWSNIKTWYSNKPITEVQRKSGYFAGGATTLLFLRIKDVIALIFYPFGWTEKLSNYKNVVS
jgi:hypothetical protein